MPAEERKARGTYRSDRDTSSGTAYLPPGMPSLPRGMPTEARRLWRTLARRLLDAGLLSDLDGTTLERYCRAYVVWRDLITKAEAGGEDAGKEARRWEREALLPLGAALGLNYAARSRVRAPQNTKPDETELEVFGLKAVVGGRSEQ